MFFALPIRAEPTPPGRPWATYGLIAANVGVYLFMLPMATRGVNPSDPKVLEYLHTMARVTGQPAAAILGQTSLYDLIIFEWGFRPTAPSVVTLLSSMFLHGGFMHVAGNMLFLWIYGNNVEHELGRVKYVLAYVAMGVVATLTFAVFSLDSPVPMVGASGAISGVLGCYFLWFPRNQVKVLTIIFWFINVLTIPARWVLGFFLVVDNIIPFLFSSGGSVAHGAHIGGFFAGLGLAYVVANWGQLGPRLQAVFTEDHPAQRSPTQSSGISPADIFHGAVLAESFDQAFREYTLMSTADQAKLDDEDVLAVADYLTEIGDYGGALGILRRFIATHPTSENLSRAYLRAGLIQLRALSRPTAAYQYFLNVLDLDPPYPVERAARKALAEIDLARRARFH